MSKKPDFVIIGGMKCATSTLHEQLVLQPGFFLSEPKEPNFFSDDEQYQRGTDWYLSLFEGAKPTDLCGESSTHYTKLPTYPHAVERLQAFLPDAKFIYVMRHPIDRLVSQYIHEWTERKVGDSIDEAIATYSPLIDYSLYSRQLTPYFEAFGQDRVLPVFFERMLSHSQPELERICRFLGYAASPVWQDNLDAQNVSSERLRTSVWRDAIVEAPILKPLRQKLVPKSFRTWVRGLWMIKGKPKLTPEQIAHLQTVFDPDLAILGSWLGIELTCQNFKTQVKSSSWDWQPTKTVAE